MNLGSVNTGYRIKSFQWPGLRRWMWMAVGVVRVLGFNGSGGGVNCVLGQETRLDGNGGAGRLRWWCIRSCPVFFGGTIYVRNVICEH
ncbi:hypothetical protein BYT27DRAFT_6610282 [Phlegmacium glaucopus]|nr:hypothetical protein BYT27DRAFT_6610282 [Phlegmacium glaucopus]